MSLSDDLFKHAVMLWSQFDQSAQDEAMLRRAISASYYGLFHQIKEAAVEQIGPSRIVDGKSSYSALV